MKTIQVFIIENEEKHVLYETSSKTDAEKWVSANGKANQIYYVGVLKTEHAIINN